MKKIITLLLLAWAAQWAVAQEADTAWRGIDNTFLYERYATRQDLMVAQMVHYPIGDGMFVNLVMLQAQDSATFVRLLDEFELMMNPKDLPLRLEKYFATFMARDIYNPTKPAPTTPEGKVDFSKSCMVIAYYDDQTLWIANYKNEAECSQLIALTTILSSMENRYDADAAPLATPNMR